VIFGPWMSLSMATFQEAVPPTALPQLLAARSSVLIIAAPLGTALGGPPVAVLGASGTLLASGLATVTLAVIFIAASAFPQSTQKWIRNTNTKKDAGVKKGFTPLKKQERER
jgi:hypothetical protein